ncbi:MAG: hypothetical protein PHU51_03930 [Candidatus Nanoarchaeia archaeon]|nr:hypothetical protein [Candidatus Nanoarchaeia archaeon]
MNKKLENLLDNHGTKLVSVGVGMFWGTMDCISSGLPVLTIGLPLYELPNVIVGIIDNNICPEMNKPEKITNLLKGYISYSIGASIPFAIKYHQEIINYTSNIMDKLS